jgi:diacylglycerol kinase family enzyme
MAAEIRDLFSNYPEIHYDIHITRWKRDALGFARRYVSNTPEIVRVYTIGGTGTLFEVISGVTDLPNVQIAHYPMGVNNTMLRSLGGDGISRCRSLRNLTFADTIALDAIRVGHNFAFSLVTLGAEAMIYRRGEVLYARTKFASERVCCFLAGLYLLIRNQLPSQHYRVEIDGVKVDGDYVNISIANSSWYTSSIHPATEARPDDGFLDIYLYKAGNRLQILRPALDYLYGNYGKWPNRISHFRGKTISVSSDTFMWICNDGEIFFDTSIRSELIPGAVNFVFPKGIQSNKIEEKRQRG